MSNIAVKPYNERERFYEIIGGKKYMPPAPVIDHHDTVYTLQTLFKSILNSKKFSVYGELVDVVFDNENTVQPDLKIISDFSMVADGKNIKGAPDFVVEVLSPSNLSHDLVVKKNLYQKHGVKEYWIVDIYTKNINVYILENGGYNDPVIYHYYSDKEIKEIENGIDDIDKEQIKIKEIVTHTFGEELHVPINKIFENI
ncbi:MAG: Uma2 family endonuclease [Oscillospiraceae bacterium]|nr:Uma2 family endonuclease [Oscillospiraceae bacterium]